MEATSAYRQEMDVLSTFISERCVQGPHLRTTVKELYAGYLSWCQQAGEAPLTPKAFGLCLEEKGFQADKAAQGVRIRRGLALMASQEA
jgi:putative DNA primase/helicase